MQKTIDILGEMEAKAMGLTYEQYIAWLSRGAYLNEQQPKVMAATAGR